MFPVPLEGTASEIAIRERRPVRYEDVFNDPGVPPGLREIVVAEELFADGRNTCSGKDRAIGSILGRAPQ